MDPAVLLTGLLVFFFLTAIVLAAAEISLIRVRRVRVAAMADDGHRGAGRVLRLLDDLPQVLNTILLVVLLVQIGAAAITGLLAERWFGNLGVTVASILLTFLLFVYSEAIPKTFAYHHPARVAVAVSRPVTALTALLRPLVRFLVWLADLHAPGTGVATSPSVTERELRLLAAEAAGEGEITQADLELIERAFRLGDRTIEEVMVPRTDIVGVTVAMPAGEALRTAQRAGHRRLLVYGDDLDELYGVVALRDLAGVNPATPVGQLAGPSLAIPERTRLINALEQMQQHDSYLAVVVDEHGGISGLVTVEDIAEEILGAVSEDAPPPGEVLRSAGPGRWTVGGRVPVADLAEATGKTLPEGDWTTAAGLVMGLAGRIPRVGDEVTAGGLRLRVTAVSGRRVRRLDVTLSEPGSETGA
jgi:CBS domain containing-hemolysin-like protein